MNKEVRATIGRRLRESRIAAKLSQKTVAGELHVQRQTISAWECGKSLPAVPEWHDLGLLYGTSLDYLVYGVRTVPVSRGLMMGTVFAAAGVQPTGSTFGQPA